MSKVMKSTKKPRILVIGGEEARNFGSKELQALFEFEHVDRDKDSIPKFVGQHFHAVVVLPWRSRHMPNLARKFAAARKIPCLVVSSIGQIKHYLAESNSFFKSYLAENTRKEAEKSPETPEAKPAVSLEPEQHRWDEDQLWDAYGEHFVTSIKGLDGEVTDRKTFVELLEGESGLKGEPVEVLMSILRRQGIISEYDNGMISIGQVNPVDVEKRKQFIESQQTPTNGHGNGKEQGRTGSALEMLSEVLLGYYAKLDPKRVWKHQKDLNDELGKLGLGKTGKPFSHYYMNLLHKRVRGLGVVFANTGVPHAFRIQMPGTAPIQKEVIATSPPRPVEKVVEKPVEEKPRSEGILTTKPFASIFPKEEEKVKEVPAKEAPVSTDLSASGALYEAIRKRYTNGRIPDLGAMTPSVKTFKGIFHESQWDLAACRGIMSKLRLDDKDEQYKLILSKKRDFTDGEWIYFAFDFLRDQTIMSLLPIVDNRNRVYRNCEDCDRGFHFNIPIRCYECKERALGRTV